MLYRQPRLLLLLIQNWFVHGMGGISQRIGQDVLKAQLFVVLFLFRHLIQYRTHVRHQGHLIRYDVCRDTIPFDRDQMGQCDGGDHDDLSRWCP